MEINSFIHISLLLKGKAGNEISMKLF